MRTRYPSVVLALLMLGLPAVFAQTGASPSTAAPVGTTLAGILECGEGYTSHELYDVKITIREVVRGDAAWKQIQDSDRSNKPPAGGTDYLLARVRFEYYARGNPGTCVHHLVPEQFTAYSSAGEDYRSPSVAPPKPEMRKSLKSGEFIEGWLVFAVPTEDRTPLLSFSADAGGSVQHGEPKWFLLR